MVGERGEGHDEHVNRVVGGSSGLRMMTIASKGGREERILEMRKSWLGNFGGEGDAMGGRCGRSVRRGRRREMGGRGGGEDGLWMRGKRTEVTGVDGGERERRNLNWEVLGKIVMVVSGKIRGLVEMAAEQGRRRRWISGVAGSAAALDRQRRLQHSGGDDGVT